MAFERIFQGLRDDEDLARRAAIASDHVARAFEEVGAGRLVLEPGCP